MCMEKIRKSDYDVILNRYFKGDRSEVISKDYNSTVSTINRIISLCLKERGLEKRVRSNLPCRNDVTGQKFGDLEVIRMESPKFKMDSWKAVCKCHKCGNENFIIAPKRLKPRITMNCGCCSWERKKGKDNKMFKGCEGITGSFFHQIRKNATTRKITFDLNIEYIWNLFLQQNGKCKLSDIELSLGKSNYDERNASLDRIDSSKGYINGNVQWIHKDINFMKNSFSQDKFLKYIELIYKNNFQHKS